MRVIVNVLGVLLTGGVILLSADVFRSLGLSLHAEQYGAALLALALPLVYLHVPAKGGKRESAVPWYDVIAALVSFAVCIYVAVMFPPLSELVARHPWDGLGPAIVLALLLLEGLRRTTGIALPLVTLGFFLVALMGGMLPGEMAGRSIPIERLTYFIVWDSTAIFGIPMKIITTVVVSFVLFGNVLFKSGGSRFFTDISMALMGRYRGGPAKISILGSSLFGTISGSVVANVVTTGVVTIPLMKRLGFRPQLAAAVESVSSTGGQLMPPVMGIAAFIMAEFLQVPYTQVVLAALIPSLLFYIALFIQADLEAVRAGITRLPEEQIPRLGTVLKKGWYFPLPFVALIAALFWWNMEPQMAALLGTAVLIAFNLVFGFEGKRIGWRDLYDMLRGTAFSVLDLFMIGAAAGVIIGVLNYSGTGFSLTLALIHLAGGNLLALLVLSGAVCIILGMGMPTVGVYILLATLVAPALIEMKIEPMAAHMFILYYGCLSMITPPVAIGAFAAANLAGADAMKSALEAVRFGWTVFVIPFLFVFSTTLLMQGDPLMIVLDFIAAIAGVWLGATAVIGYSVRLLGPGARLYYAAAGLFLLVPLYAFDAGRLVNLLGACMALALFIWEKSRRVRAVPV
jgi:TRAP transporter 4TM/12TM fusion protein